MYIYIYGRLFLKHDFFLKNLLIKLEQFKNNLPLNNWDTDKKKLKAVPIILFGSSDNWHDVNSGEFQKEDFTWKQFKENFIF